MAMFKKAIRIFGKHADIMQKYCKDKGGEQDIPFIVSANNGDESKAIYIFENRIQIYLVAGMLGIIQNRQADVDHSTETYSTIMAEMVEKQRPNLERMYQHMVLALDNADADTRIKNAFTINKTDEQWEEEQKRLENYVRGGLEIIDEIFGSCHSYEAICNAIYDLKDQIGL